MINFRLTTLAVVNGLAGIISDAADSIGLSIMRGLLA